MADNPNYEYLIDRIIKEIRKDSSADSATVERLVERLHELQAAGAATLRVGEGLVGGGVLDKDVTVGLSEESLEYIRRAAAAVDEDGLGKALAGYATRELVDEKIKAIPAPVSRSVVTFSVPGAVSSSGTVSPPLRLPSGSWSTDGVGLAVGETGGEVKVNVTVGGKTWYMTVEAGKSEKTYSLDVAVSGVIRVEVKGSNASGVTVAVGLKRREG